MTRKQFFAAVASTALALAVGVTQALRTVAQQNEIPKEQVAQWLRDVDSERFYFFVAIRNDVAASLPVAFEHSTEGAWLLGDRNGRDMQIGTLRYGLDVARGVAFGGGTWRLALGYAPKKILKSWSLFAEEVGGVQFLGSHGEAWGACVAQVNETQCGRLFSALVNCWDYGDGSFCHNGVRKGGSFGGGFLNPDDPDPVACEWETGATPRLCSHRYGERPASIAIQITPDLSGE